jgi:hypothetical protein
MKVILLFAGLRNQGRQAATDFDWGLKVLRSFFPIQQGDEMQVAKRMVFLMVLLLCTTASAAEDKENMVKLSVPDAV